MRFEITGNWNDGFKHDGMLYCAQRIEEMLMPYTSHLYKVPVYNTFLLAYEFMEVYNTVKNKSIDQAHLKNILEEFIESFENDIVIKEHFDEEQIKYFVGRLTGSSISEQRRTMHYLIHVMNDYPNWCVETLKNAVLDPKAKKKIDKALRSYVPMIIGIGYNPHYIYRQCRSFFSKQDISNTDALKDFLAYFDGVEKSFVVYFAVDKRVEKFKTMLEERLGVSFDQDEFSKKIRYDNNKQVCLHAEITALDPNGAAERAYANFDLFLRFYRFLGNRDREWIHDHCLVKDENDNVVFPHIGPEKYFYSQDYDDKTLGKNSERIITKLIENTGGNDFFRIDKIIRTHNTALASSDIKNAFLNLWSILEIIGVDEYGADQSKIKQVLNNVVPILKRNYLSRVVEEIHDYLKANISQDEYAKVIGRIEEEGSEDYKIACLVSLEKYADLRKEISGYLGNYPLIRSRICQLYEDILKNKKKYCAETDRYERRLRWHIQRLYRVRNQIIHSGDGNDNMVYLVEHLHSYVDEVILDIIDRTTRDESLGSVANVLLDAQVFSENFNKGRTKDKEFTAEEITYLLQ